MARESRGGGIHLTADASAPVIILTQPNFMIGQYRDPSRVEGRVTAVPNQSIRAPDRAGSLYKLLRAASRDRLVAPSGQPFAFMTHRGKVRADNQDTALVLAGRRTPSSQVFLAAILCDGMGGLDAGDDAAALAAASAGGVLACDARMSPSERMALAIRRANSAVFEHFRGRAGAALVSVLADEGEAVIGWVGDARAYDLHRGVDPRPLTRDDTIASEVARIEGAAPEAMDALLRAVGTRPDVEPHVIRVEPGVQTLLLVSDGVHRLEPAALAWVCRHAQTSRQLVERLSAAASWQGGIDNATSLALPMDSPPTIDEDGPILAAWVEDQPRIWERETSEHRVESAVAPQSAEPSMPAGRHEPQTATAPKRKRQRRAKSRDDPERPLRRPEQVPLGIELGDPTADKP